MKKIWLSFLGIICIICIVCTRFLKVTLTVQDIKTLAQKGYNLTWSDFDSYKGNEIGFGLYIKSYPIKDFNGYLLIGGDKRIPCYIKIRKNSIDYDSSPIESKDIRSNNITYFLENS